MKSPPWEAKKPFWSVKHENLVLEPKENNGYKIKLKME